MTITPTRFKNPTLSRLPWRQLSAVINYVATDGVTYTPYTDFTYDDVSGNVVLNTEIPAGTEVDVDLYTDGFFENDLDPTQQRILGLCVAYDWYFRMANAYLNVINPITDKTFSPRSATSEDKRANTARFTELGRQISSELMAYEQRLYALKYIPREGWRNLVVDNNMI